MEQSKVYVFGYFNKLVKSHIYSLKCKKDQKYSFDYTHLFDPLSFADKVFLLAMKDAQPKVAGWKIWSAWKAVDLFGRWSIVPNEKNI